jgi:hypothetical protein
MIDAGGDVKPLIEALAARGIRVGRRFAALPTWLRVTIGTPEETRAFLEAFRAVASARLRRRGLAPFRRARPPRGRAHGSICRSVGPRPQRAPASDDARRLTGLSAPSAAAAG